MKRGTLVRGFLALAGTAALVIGLVHFASSKTLSPEERTVAEKGIYKNGVPLDVVRARRWPGLDEWEDAVEKFPTLESCLVLNRAGRKSLTVDWSKVSSDVEASVCISRIASRIRTVEGVAAWFSQHGFRVVGIRAVPWTQTSPEATERTATAIETGWLTNTQGPLYKGGLVTWAVQQLGWVHAVSCNVYFGKRGIAIWTACVSNTL